MRPVAGSGKKGWRDGLAADSSFNAPAGVWERADGSIAVANTRNHCIRLIYVSKCDNLAVWTIAGGYVHRWSELTHERGWRSAHHERTRTAYRKRGHPDGAKSLFRSPTDIVEGPHGELTVADTANNCIRVRTTTCNDDHTAPWVARALCCHTGRVILSGFTSQQLCAGGEEQTMTRSS